MRTLTLKKAALVAVVPLALASLTACGGGESPGTATPASSGGNHSAATSTGSHIESAGFLHLVQGAAAKITTAKVSMAGTASGQRYTMKGALDLTGSKPAMDMTMNLGSAGMSGVEMRLVDDTMYMRLGQMTQGKFVKFDLNDPSSPLGSLTSSLDQLDPSKMMSDLKPSTFRGVRLVGTDSSGKHYHAVLVTANAPQLKGLPASETADLPKTMAYDVWLDGKGRLTKFVVSIPKLLKLTAHYTDYGAPVHIAAPPASQITAMPGSSSSL
ncbi:MAG TPA: hypothetical protein VHW64_00725 [Nocardioides sp.]|jgi:hypothetical protein|uniref:hypothetical protein n=1 Tax=Nocardioides sp. TaxID=35761 RepID=UPI002E31624C|nr:hypothetical protein [Nocardioides sp.]HEX3929198.1 hypothetical protein [Nocardioides sp.]